MIVVVVDCIFPLHERDNSDDTGTTVLLASSRAYLCQLLIYIRSKLHQIWASFFHRQNVTQDVRFKVTAQGALSVYIFD